MPVSLVKFPSTFAVLRSSTRSSASIFVPSSCESKEYGRDYGSVDSFMGCRLPSICRLCLCSEAPALSWWFVVSVPVVSFSSSLLTWLEDEGQDSERLGSYSSTGFVGSQLSSSTPDKSALASKLLSCFGAFFGSGLLPSERSSMSFCMKGRFAEAWNGLNQVLLSCWRTHQSRCQGNLIDILFETTEVPGSVSKTAKYLA